MQGLLAGYLRSLHIHPADIGRPDIYRVMGQGARLSVIKPLILQTIAIRVTAVTGIQRKIFPAFYLQLRRVL